MLDQIKIFLEFGSTSARMKQLLWWAVYT